MQESATSEERRENQHSMDKLTNLNTCFWKAVFNKNENKKNVEVGRTEQTMQSATKNMQRMDRNVVMKQQSETNIAYNRKCMIELEV